MDSSPEAIVEQLIAQDSSLKGQKQELVRIVKLLRKEQPRVDVRKGFEEELRRELQRHIAQRQQDAPSSISSFSFFSMLKQVFLAGGGVLVGAFLAVVILSQDSLVPGLPNGESVPRPGITSAGDNAFGSLKLTTEAGGLGGGGGGGGVANYAESSFYEPGMDGDRLIYPIDYTVSRYTYEGDLSIPSDEVTVYRRIRPESKPAASNVISGFAGGMFNWNKLGGMRLHNVQMTQNGSSPYSVFIDYNEGSISMHRVFGPGDRPEYSCQTPECWERNRLREGDMIANDQLIAITNQFAQEFGLDLSQYGEPQIVDDWRIWLEQTEDKASFYYPEQVSVVYPLMIDGKMVYEDYGQPYGLQIGVDIRSKEVASVYNYFFIRYEQSGYDVVESEQSVRDAIERGTIYNWVDPNATAVYSQLGEPTEALLHYMQWDPETNESKDLLVPALMFQVTERNPEATDNRQRVIVPLAQDFYEEQSGNFPIPLPRPLPVEPLEAPATDEAQG